MYFADVIDNMTDAQSLHKKFSLSINYYVFHCTPLETVSEWPGPPPLSYHPCRSHILLEYKMPGTTADWKYFIVFNFRY